MVADRMRVTFSALLTISGGKPRMSTIMLLAFLFDILTS